MVNPYISHRFVVEKNPNGGQWLIYEKLVGKPERQRLDLGGFTSLDHTESYLRSMFPFATVSRREAKR